MHTIKVNSCAECPCLGREPEEHDTPLKYVCGLNRELDFFDVDVIICIHKACPLLQAAYTIQLKGRTSFDAQTMNNPPADNPLAQAIKKALETGQARTGLVAPMAEHLRRRLAGEAITPQEAEGRAIKEALLRPCHHVYELGTPGCIKCGANR